MTSTHTPRSTIRAAIGAPPHADGTITVPLAAPPRLLEQYGLLSLYMPPNLPQGVVAGRYVLARCGAQSEEERREQWHIYFRRPLFVASTRHHHPSSGADSSTPVAIWELLLPLDSHAPDPGYRWLAGLKEHDSLNLIGLLGNGFRLEEGTRNLVLTAPVARMATLLPLIDPVLDRGGRVTVLVRSEEPPIDLIARLPLAVEVNTVASEIEWTAALQELLPWADQLCAALPQARCATLANEVRNKRFRLEPGFAQVLLDAPLYCGIGACLACTVPLSSGKVTRACIHGPVFDLTQL